MPSTRLIGILLFLGSTLLYMAVSRHKYVAYDAASMVGVAHDLVNHFSLNAAHGFTDYLHLSTPYSPYGVGLSLVIAPFYSLSKITGNEPLVLSLINPLITACTVVVAFAIGQALGWSRTLSVLGAVVFGVLTMALQATTELFSEPAVSLCIALLVWGILRWRDDYRYAPIVIGLSAAAAVQFRSDSVVTVWIGLLALPFFVPWRSILKATHLCALLIPMGLSLIALGAYNYVRWHSVLKFSYNGEGFGTPLGRGLEGLLFSPGKSLFIFNPIALLGVAGLLLLVKRDRPVGVLFLLLIVPRIVFFAKWASWEGGVDWGPRFLEPIVLLLVLASVDLLHRTSRRTAEGRLVRIAFAALCVVSVGVSFLSVRVPYEQWFGALANPGIAAHYEHRGVPVPAVSSSDVSAPYDFTLGASQIRGDLVLLEHGAAEVAPAEFQGRSEPIGWLLLLAGSALLIAAGLGAAGSDRRKRRRGTERGDRTRPDASGTGADTAHAVAGDGPATSEVGSSALHADV